MKTENKVWMLIGSMKNKLNEICIVGVFQSYEGAEKEQEKIIKDPYFDNYYIESFLLNP